MSTLHLKGPDQGHTLCGLSASRTWAYETHKQMSDQLDEHLQAGRSAAICRKCAQIEERRGRR